MSLRPKKRSVALFFNIVPLIDVLIVLIFFFMVTMQFKNLTILDLTPPKMETAASETLPDNAVIGIDTEGVFYFKNNPLSAEELEKELKQFHAGAKDTGVLVLADQDSALRYMTQVMDITKKAGVGKVRLQVRQ